MRYSVHQVMTDDHVAISLELYQIAERNTVLIVCPGFFQSCRTPTFRCLCQDLAQKWDVMGMDFRGHGRSGGWFTFSASEMRDISAVVQFARSRYSRIIILGFSLGAAAAINFVAKGHSIHQLITISAPTCFEEIGFKFWTPQAIQTGLRGLEKGAGFRPGNLWLKKERPIDNIKKISSVPILFIHGTKDPIISYHHSDRLYEVAGEPKRLVLIQGGGHAQDLYRRSREQFLSAIREGV